MTWRMFFFVFVPGTFIAYVLGYLTGANVATSSLYIHQAGQFWAEVFKSDARMMQGEDK